MKITTSRTVYHAPWGKASNTLLRLQEAIKKEARILCRRLTVWYNDKKSAFGYVDTVDLGYAEYGLDRFRLYQYLL